VPWCSLFLSFVALPLLPGWLIGCWWNCNFLAVNRSLSQPVSLWMGRTGRYEGSLILFTSKEVKSMLLYKFYFQQWSRFELFGNCR